MFLKLSEVDAVGSFFKYELKDFLRILNGADKDKRCYANRENRVNQGKIGKFHNDGSDEHDEPTEDVLKHMKIYRPLI